MSTKETPQLNLGLVSIIVTIIIIVLWIGTYFYLVDNPDKGTIGDMFGSINALFSGFALAGIILAILLQRNDLQLQREELKLTRQEFKIQNDTLKLQRFENTFFNILNVHHQIVSNMELSVTKTITQGTAKTVKETVYKGRKLFTKEFEFFLSNQKGDETRYLESYDKIYNLAIGQLGHYFRNLYQIIKLVDSTFFYADERLNFEEQYKYVSIVRAQLSDHEMALLFYNCLHKNGKEKFKPLLEKYTFFKNINNDLVFDSHKQLYDEKAFIK